jgi:cytochrome c-type biogenesis protein CcmH
MAPAASSSDASRNGDGLKPEFIRSMVEGLAGRLKQDGSDLNGWLMLVRSYVVLGETDKAKDAFASAKANFKDQPDALRKLDDLARQLGLS